MTIGTGYTTSIKSQQALLDLAKDTPKEKQVARMVRAVLRGLEGEVKLAAQEREEDIKFFQKVGTRAKAANLKAGLATEITNNSTEAADFAKDLEQIKEIDAMAQKIIGQSYAGYAAIAVGAVATGFTGFAVYAMPAIRAYLSQVNGTAV